VAGRAPGEEAIIEAAHLAAKLGLSVAEMQRGLGEDAGRLRLTFRYRARS
jgi:hypothetical protein